VKRGLRDANHPTCWGGGLPRSAGAPRPSHTPSTNGRIRSSCTPHEPRCESWRGVKVLEFETRQLQALRQHLQCAQAERITPADLNGKSSPASSPAATSRLISVIVTIGDVPAPFVAASGNLNPSVITLFWRHENGKSA